MDSFFSLYSSGHLGGVNLQLIHKQPSFVFVFRNPWLTLEMQPPDSGPPKEADPTVRSAAAAALLGNVGCGAAVRWGLELWARDLHWNEA